MFNVKYGNLATHLTFICFMLLLLQPTFTNTCYNHLSFVFIKCDNVHLPGVIIANKYNGTWSPPSALGLGGIGWGFMVGAEVKVSVSIILYTYHIVSYNMYTLYAYTYVLTSNIYLFQHKPTTNLYLLHKI